MDYRSSHTNRGADYHETFTEHPHARMLWELEQRTIDDVIRVWFNGRVTRYLDFACGTGRVLAHVSQYADESTGVDISASMLAVARKTAPGAELILGDITREELLEDRSFDLISAFRFFPNAQPQLRSEALVGLMKLLAPNGVLITNNHLNASSTAAAVTRALGRRSGNLVSDGEIRALLSSEGLVIEEAWGLGFLPMTDKHYYFARPAEYVEGRLRRKGKIRGARDVVYVARRAV